MINLVEVLTGNTSFRLSLFKKIVLRVEYQKAIIGDGIFYVTTKPQRNYWRDAKQTDLEYNKDTNLWRVKNENK